jgi:hypothetical protein
MKNHKPELIVNVIINRTNNFRYEVFIN